MTTNDTSRSGKPCGVQFEGDWLPLAGVSVAAAKALLRDAWNIAYFAEATVNGRPTGVGYVLLPGDRLGFSKRYGYKAGADRPAEEIEADGLLAAYPELSRISEEVARLGLPAADALRVMTVRVSRWLWERFGPPDVHAGAVFMQLMQRLESIECRLPPTATSATLTIRESEILEALGELRLTGEELAPMAGYEYDSHFKGILASLVKRGLLANLRPGYVRHPARQTGHGPDRQAGPFPPE